MIIFSKSLFCLNIKNIFNKWKATGKKKKKSLTQLQFVNIEEEKKRKRKKL